MERYIRDKWERKLFKEIPPTPPKEEKNHITDLQQLGGSSTSISTPSISSTTSSLPSSPTMQLAGRAATIDTIYSLAPTKNTAHSYNPFVTLPVSSTFSSGKKKKKRIIYEKHFNTKKKPFYLFFFFF